MSWCNDQVEEALDRVESSNEVGVSHEPLCDVFSCFFGLFLRNAQEGEGNDSEVTLEVGTCLLHLHLIGSDVSVVEGFDGLDYGSSKQFFDVHCI